MKNTPTLFFLIIVILCFTGSNIQAQKVTKSKPLNNIHKIKKERKLRSVYYANGGVLAYFSDGTVTGCARCEFCKSNLESMSKSKPSKTYKVEADGSLTVNGVETEHPKADDIADHWPLIDYKWNEKVPQY